MNQINEATGYERNCFFKDYCQNERDRTRMLEDFKVELDSYEELPIGRSVYGAAGNGKKLWETIMVFKVTDNKNKRCYYPAFSENIGKKLARAAQIEFPPKMTVLDEEELPGLKKEDFDPSNYALLCLLQWIRWLTLMLRNTPLPMPYGFWSIYTVLLSCPKDDVDVSVIKLVNNTLKNILQSQEEVYLDCNNLQEYITYMKENYEMLRFKNSDFSILREKLWANKADEKIYF